MKCREKRGKVESRLIAGSSSIASGIIYILVIELHHLGVIIDSSGPSFQSEAKQQLGRVAKGGGLELGVGVGLLLVAAAVVRLGFLLLVVGGYVDVFWPRPGLFLQGIIILGAGLIFLVLHLPIF